MKVVSKSNDNADFVVRVPNQSSKETAQIHNHLNEIFKYLNTLFPEKLFKNREWERQHCMGNLFLHLPAALINGELFTDLLEKGTYSSQNDQVQKRRQMHLDRKVSNNDFNACQQQIKQEGYSVSQLKKQIDHLLKQSSNKISKLVRCQNEPLKFPEPALTVKEALAVFLGSTPENVEIALKENTAAGVSEAKKIVAFLFNMSVDQVEASLASEFSKSINKLTVDLVNYSAIWGDNFNGTTTNYFNYLIEHRHLKEALYLLGDVNAFKPIFPLETALTLAQSSLKR